MLDEYSQLRITTFIVSCLSTIANIVIMITCHRHPVIGQTLSRKLIYYQTLADLIGNISFIFLSPYHTIQCNILGIFIFIMNISCVFWTVIMSFVLQLVTNVNRNPIFPASKYFTYYHIFCWIFPSILSLLPYFHGRKTSNQLYFFSSDHL